MTTGNYGAFRRIWLGATVSATGDAASWIALVGLVRAAVFALVPISAAAGAVPAPLLYAVAAVYGLLKMVGLAGFPALIPQLVGDDQLSRANALEGASYGLASLAGACLGGLVIGTFGHLGAIGLVAFDAVSYLVFAGLLLTVRPEPARPFDSSGGTSESAGLAAVVRLVLRRPVLRSITAMFALFNIGEGILIVFLPRRSAAIGLGAGGYGYLVAALTLGELAAAGLLARSDWRRPLVPSILVCQLAAAAIVMILIADSGAITIIAMAALGFVSAPMTAWAQTLRMREAPSAMHGRLFAVLRTAMQATPPIGAAIAAALSHAGAGEVIGCVAAIMALPVLGGAFDLLRVSSTAPQTET